MPPAAVNTAEGFSELERVWCQSCEDLILGEARGILELLERSKREREGLVFRGKPKKSSMGKDKVANAPTATHLRPLPFGGVKAQLPT